MCLVLRDTDSSLPHHAHLLGTTWLQRALEVEDESYRNWVFGALCVLEVMANFE